MYDKETLEKKRQQAQKMYQQQHLNKTEIARRLAVSWNFVHRWTKEPDLGITDQRGWPSGKSRSHTKQEEFRVTAIRKELEEIGFFYGAGKIMDEYKSRFPSEPQLNRSYVNRVISKHFPMSRRNALKAVREHNYPIEAISSLGNIQEEADFLGKKYIHNRTAPIHFFTRVYKKPFTLRLIKRVPDEGSETILDTFTEDWKVYPLPDVLSIDNGFGFTSAGRGQRYLSAFIQYLLHLGVAPLFIAPKKPWMNGSVEGTHSVFARKIWNRFDFRNLEEVDETVARFQEEYRKYTNTPDLLPGRLLDLDFSWRDLFQKSFHPRDGMYIYLIRLVQTYNRDEVEIPAITLFQDLIELEKAYLNQYVLTRLDVNKGLANIFIQPDGEELKLIAEKDFPLRFSKNKY
ncbi:MAG: hypothetical protein K0B06_06275 [Brevefilum sp.]|nr:hypothetical protein [Brevefilum sp.]